MSIMGMRKIFQRKIHVGIGRKKVSLGSPMEIIFWIIMVIFVIGSYYMFGSPQGPTEQTTANAARKVVKVVAKVNGQPITRLEFDKRYIPQASDLPQAEFITNDQYLKTQLLDGMIQRIVMLDAAKKEGINVSNADVNAKIDALIEEDTNKRFPNRKAMAKFLKKKEMTLEQYQADLKKKMFADKDGIRESVIFEKLQEAVQSKVQVSDQDLQDNYMKVKARHILISPDRLKQDAAAKNKDAKAADTTDYKALAKTRAEEVLARIKKGEDFAKLAKEFSHDPGSAAQGGMLGSGRPPAPGTDPTLADYFGRGEMVPAFDKAAFSLEKNAVSELVETDFGFHIIQVIDKKQQLPKDFDKKKEDYRKEILEKRKAEAWQQYEDELLKAAQIEVIDPEMAAYRALKEDKKAEAVQLLTTALENDPENIGAKFQLATLIKESGDKDQAIKLFRELEENDRASNAPVVRMQLAELYMEKKMTQDAINAYKVASELAQTYDYQSYFIHQQVMQKFTELGQKEMAQQEQVWIDDFMKNQAENGGMGGGMPFTMPPQ